LHSSFSLFPQKDSWRPQDNRIGPLRKSATLSKCQETDLESNKQEVHEQTSSQSPLRIWKLNAADLDLNKEIQKQNRHFFYVHVIVCEVSACGTQSLYMQH